MVALRSFSLHALILVAVSFENIAECRPKAEILFLNYLPKSGMCNKLLFDIFSMLFYFLPGHKFSLGLYSIYFSAESEDFESIPVPLHFDSHNWTPKNDHPNKPDGIEWFRLVKKVPRYLKEHRGNGLIRSQIADDLSDLNYQQPKSLQDVIADIMKRRKMTFSRLRRNRVPSSVQIPSIRITRGGSTRITRGDNQMADYFGRM